MPTPDQTPESEPKMAAMEPIPVTVIGKGHEVGQSGTIGETPQGQANFISHVISPVSAIFIRAAHRFVDALIGASALSGIDSAAGWHLIHGGAFKAALLYACVVAGWGILRDMGTILTKLEGRFPLSSGNV